MHINVYLFNKYDIKHCQTLYLITLKLEVSFHNFHSNDISYFIVMCIFPPKTIVSFSYQLNTSKMLDIGITDAMWDERS